VVLMSASVCRVADRMLRDDHGEVIVQNYNAMLTLAHLQEVINACSAELEVRHLLRE
jgi:hypothetical protein